MAIGKLSIGTDTDRVYLIGATGWFVGDWTPQAGDHLGTFAESALADYRAMMSYRDLTTIDTFTLKLSRGSQDELIAVTQDLRRMLRKAIDYWTTDWQREPVYIEAQADCETNIRYAIIHDARLPEDRNPYAPPFMGDKSTMDNLTLVIEHSPWCANPPGIGTCVQVSGEQVAGAEATDTGLPAQSTDDVYYGTFTGTYSAIGDIYIGTAIAGTDIYTSGIRFNGMAIPNGATIVSAYMTLVASVTLGVNPCTVKVYGEDYDDVVTYAGIGDFTGRTLTTASAVWSDIPDWTAGSSYNSCDISSIIQEIVDRPGWVNGNDIAIRIDPWDIVDGALRRAYSWDTGEAGSRPVLTIVYATTASTYGRSATCNNEVYISNKQNKAQITDAYYHRGAAWSTNRIGAAKPEDLFTPGGLATGDELYFGISNAYVNYGPFSSLVFDIATAATYVGAPTLTWQYWNGAWVALTTVDNTRGPLAVGPGPFAATGVNSVHWVQPSNWQATAVNGVTGWWVRLVATIAGGESISTPTQANRDIYSVLWGSGLIDDAQVLGDIPALLRCYLHNPSSDITIAASAVNASDRVIMGLRSVSRGNDFSAYINLGNKQNPTGILNDDKNLTVFANSPSAITGTWAVYTPGGAGGFSPAITVEFGSSIFYQYVGTFHAYLRAKQTGGVAGEIGARLQYGYASLPDNLMTFSEEAYTHTTTVFELLDLGKIQLPAFPTTINDHVYELFMTVDTCCIGTGAPSWPTLTIEDLILIPVDEWAAEIIRPLQDGDATGSTGTANNSNYFDLDGISNPKNIQIYVRSEAYDYPLLSLTVHTNNWPIIFPNKDQRLWMLSAIPHAVTNVMEGRLSMPSTVHSIQMFDNSRYLSMRGNR